MSDDERTVKEVGEPQEEGECPLEDGECPQTPHHVKTLKSVVTKSSAAGQESKKPDEVSETTSI